MGFGEIKENKMAETTTQTDRVRFSYLRDEMTPERVLTVARVYHRDSNSMKFGWSVNSPSHWKYVDQNDVQLIDSIKKVRVGQNEDGSPIFESRPGKRKVVTHKHVGTWVRGDQFSRKEGRRLAIKRMNESPLALALSGDELPLRAALSYLVREAERLELPFQVKEIAQQHLDIMDMDDKIEKMLSRESKTITIAHTPKKSWLDRLMSFFRG
jgi:hypothetical protein